MLVVDASILLATFLPDEDDPNWESLLASHDDLIAPWLLWIEVRNIVLIAERRRRLTDTIADSITHAIDAIGINYDTTPRSDAVLLLGRKQSLSAYDALYLELALRRGAILATQDHALQRAASSEGIAVTSG